MIKATQSSATKANNSQRKIEISLTRTFKNLQLEKYLSKIITFVNDANIFHSKTLMSHTRHKLKDRPFDNWEKYKQNTVKK